MRKDLCTAQLKEYNDPVTPIEFPYVTKPPECNFCQSVLDVTVDYIYHVIFDEGRNEGLCCLTCTDENWALPCAWCNIGADSEWLTCHSHETLCPVKYQLKRK